MARARREIAHGAPLIPKEFADRIATGENPIRVLREWRGLKQLQLAAKAEIGQGYLSDLERGARQGTTAALKCIAEALDVPLDLVVSN